MTQTAASQAAMTPSQALYLLRAGNERFVSGQRAERDYLAQASATATGQYPHSVVLACMDSRVPVEVVFDQGIGDVFVSRIAGNFVNTDLLESLEYATAVAGARLVVVLGHTECSAVKAACDGQAAGPLTRTLAHLAPAVDAVVNSGNVTGERSSKNSALVEAVTVAHVRRTVAQVMEHSVVIADLVARGGVRVVGGLQNICTGRVTFLEC